MVRVVIRDAQGPIPIRRQDVTKDLYVCGCGLSQSQPFCDGSHRQAAGEPDGVLVRYVRDGATLRREAVRVEPRAPPEGPAGPGKADAPA